jgi:lambda repressor-like predicted transcriptional regulator
VHLRELLSNSAPLLERTLQASEARPLKVRRAEDQRRVRFQPNHKLQPAEITALVKSYRLGTSIKALGRQYDLHEQTVRAHLERAAVELRPQQVLTADQVAEIVELYRAGATLRQLGVQCGVATGSIRNYLLRAGVELRPARRQPRQITGG